MVVECQTRAGAQKLLRRCLEHRKVIPGKHFRDELKEEKISIEYANDEGTKTMPEISRFYGIVIKMYHKEHNPPHFHAEYAEHEAIFSIATLEILEGKLPRRARNLVIQWAFERPNNRPRVAGPGSFACWAARSAASDEPGGYSGVGTDAQASVPTSA